LNGLGTVWANRQIDGEAIFALSAATVVALGVALLPLTWATLLILGSIVLVVTLVRPRFGVLLLVPAVPFGSVREVQLGVMSAGLTEVLLALVLAAWLMRMVARREIRVSLQPLGLPMLLFLGAVLLSLLPAISLQYAGKEVIKWVEVLAVYLLVAQEMDERWTRALVVTLLLTGAIAALQGIYQFLFGVGPDAFVLFDRFMRAYGTFEQPNPYAGYLGLTLPMAVGVVAAGVLQVGRRSKSAQASLPAKRRTALSWILVAAISGALMLVAMIMTWSRGAWLGLAAAIAVMALAVVVRSGRGAVLSSVFAVLAAYILLAGGLARVPPSITQRFSDFVPYLGVLDVEGVEVTDANFAVIERVAHWQAAWQMWTDHPWLGVGIGNYEPAYPQYALPSWPEALGHAHNYYLNIAAEAGVFGLLSYFLLWGAALVVAWQATRRATGWRWGVALGVLGVLVHLSVHNFFDNLFVHSMYLQVGILLGILAADWRRDRLGSSAPPAETLAY
jgi:putative inorganic carbon (HCO3(-)) transporter